MSLRGNWPEIAQEAPNQLEQVQRLRESVGMCRHAEGCQCIVCGNARWRGAQFADEVAGYAQKIEKMREAIFNASKVTPPADYFVDETVQLIMKADRNSKLEGLIMHFLAHQDRIERRGGHAQISLSPKGFRLVVDALRAYKSP